jgi:hypothetical protein
MNSKTKALKNQGAPTPFKIIGDNWKGRIKKAGKFLDKQFIEPSRNVNRIYNAKMEEMDRKSRSGEFNR